MVDASELRKSLRKKLDEAKQEATYRETVAPAYGRFCEHVFSIVQNKTDLGRWNLVLSVTAEVIASLRQFWTDGFAAEPTEALVLSQLDKILRKLIWRVTTLSVGPLRDWSILPSARKPPYLERPLQGIEFAYRHLDAAAANEFCHAVRVAASGIKRWYPNEDVKNGQYSPAQAEALNELQTLANRLRDLRTREELTARPAALVQALDRFLHQHEDHALTLVKQASDSAVPRAAGPSRPRGPGIPGAGSFRVEGRVPEPTGSIEPRETSPWQLERYHHGGHTTEDSLAVVSPGAHMTPRKLAIYRRAGTARLI